MTETSASSTRRTELSATLRFALALGGIAVLYAAPVLTIWPERSAELFTWDIQPPITAAFMGAFYASALPLLFLVAARGSCCRCARS